MIFSLEVIRTGTIDIRCRIAISSGGIHVYGNAEKTIKDAIFSAVEIAIETGIINESSVIPHLARGSGIVCAECANQNTSDCSFLPAYDCFQRKIRG